MAENESAEPEAPTVVVPPAPAAGPRLRDTVWNFRSMLAVALASLVIGGAAGSAITALANDDDGPDRVRIANFGGGHGFRNGPGETGPFGNNGPFRRFRQDDGGPDLQQTPPSPSAPQSGSTG